MNVEEKIGTVTHYYGKLGVAAIQLDDGELRPGDRIHVIGHTTDAEMTVGSIELEHHTIDRARKGQNVGIKVDERVREHDEVYKAYI